MEESNITNTADMDSSCYIVETQSEVIEINETCDDLEVSGTKDLSIDIQSPDAENDTMGDFQVIDETGFASNMDDTATENGQISTSEDPVSSCLVD